MKHIILDISNDILLANLVGIILSNHKDDTFLKQNFRIYNDPLSNSQTKDVENNINIYKSVNNKLNICLWINSHISNFNKYKKLSNFYSVKKQLIYQFEDCFISTRNVYYISDFISDEALTFSKINRYIIKQDLKIEECLSFLNISNISKIPEPEIIKDVQLNTLNNIPKEKSWEVTGLK